MGCGQSKIGIIYPRKNKRKGCNKKSGVEVDAEEEADEADRGTISPIDDDEEAKKRAAAAARVRQMVSSGPLLAHTEVSSSQLEFFKMLDERIENGRDYDATDEEELASERHRLASLLHDWESASCSTSTSSRSLPSTPARKPHRQYYLPHPPPVPLANGDLFIQQQYYQQFQQQQYQIRGQFFMPPPPMPPPPMIQPHYPRPLPPQQFVARNYPHYSHPPQQATAVVRYGKNRGVFTELA